MSFVKNTGSLARFHTQIVQSQKALPLGPESLSLSPTWKWHWFVNRRRLQLIRNASAWCMIAKRSFACHAPQQQIANITLWPLKLSISFTTSRFEYVKDGSSFPNNNEFWDRGFPTFRRGTDRCVAVANSGKVRDLDCRHRVGYVCQKEPPPGTWEKFALSLGELAVEQSKAYFGVSWEWRQFLFLSRDVTLLYGSHECSNFYS